VAPLSKQNVCNDCRNSLCDESVPSDVMEDCSIVRVQQLRILCRRRYYMSASQHMIGSLWNVDFIQDRRQDGSHRLGTMAKCQAATDEGALQPWSQHTGVSVASVAYEALALSDLNIDHQ